MAQGNPGFQPWHQNVLQKRARLGLTALMLWNAALCFAATGELHDVSATETLSLPVALEASMPEDEAANLLQKSSVFEAPVSTGETEIPASLSEALTGVGVASGSSIPALDEADASATAAIPLSLDDCIALAVRRNTTIKLAYMDRVLAKFNFQTQDGYAFRPNVTLNTTANRAGTWQSSKLDSTGGNDQVSTSLSMTQRLPSGGTIGVSAKPWSRSRSRSQTDFLDPVTGRMIDRSWGVNLSQPLLRGAGFDYGTADRRNARLAEAQNVLRLKEVVQGEVTSVIKAYRGLLQAKWAREINASALFRARRQYDMNRVLIEMGRMPKMELVQSESDVANRELTYQLSVNSYDQARIALLKLLDLDVETNIEPDETLEFPPFQFDEKNVLALIHENQPSYLSTLLSLEQTRINLMKARSDKKWALNLTGSFDKTRADAIPGDAAKNENWQVGLALEVPLYGSNKRSLTSSVLGAENELRKALIQLRKIEDDLKLEVRDTIRQIRTNARQIELATKARQLSERKLDIELEKLKAGKTTNFQLVTFQDELRNLKISELTARIAYLNALTDLDRTMGITVGLWGIELNANRPKNGPASERIASETLAIEEDSPETLEPGK